MNERTPVDTINNNPKTTILTGITTGLETLAGLLPDEKWKTIAHVTAPVLSLGVVLLLKNWLHREQCKRGIKTYTQIIADLQAEYNLSTTTDLRRKTISDEIDKLRHDIIELRKSTIAIITN